MLSPLVPHHSIDALIRCPLVRPCLVMCAFAFLSGGFAFAQETQPTDKKETSSKDHGAASKESGDRRLEEIENRLRQLLEEVKSIRTGGEKPAASGETKPEPASPLDPLWLRSVTWRAIGPANMGGRIVDLAVYNKDPHLFWVATASGGLLKTTNNGVTFEHQFDHEATVSLGAVDVAQSDPNIVWVGTGENNPRNSVSYGDGVYKSTDGGKTWKNVGLKQTYQIGQIGIHPQNPDIVYVGALGRLYGQNEERGLFKTTDGGASWQKILYVDDKTGVIDFVMHPTDPESLIVAMWERRRDGFDSWPGTEVPKADGYDGYDPIVKWGSGGGLFKTTDGGKTFKKLTKGLPSGMTGRIGLDWYPKDPNVVVAVIDCENIGKGPAPATAYLGVTGVNAEGQARVAQVMPGSPAERAGLQVGDILAAVDGQPISEFNKLLDQVRERKVGQAIKLTRKRGEESQELEITLTARPGAGGGAWLGANGEVREKEVRITQVAPDSPAAKARLKAGDVVLAIDNKEILTFDQVAESLRARSAGEKVALRIRQGTEEKEISIMLEARPSGGGFGGGFGGRAPSAAYMGIQGEDAEQGARLTVITDDGPAQKAGLRAGDIIREIDGKAIEGYEGLVESLRPRQPGDKISLKLLRGQEATSLEVTLEARPGEATSTRPYAFSYGGQSPNVQDQQGTEGGEYGGIYRSADGGESWTRINSLNSRPMYFSVIRVDPSDEKYLYVLGVSQYSSANGGVTFTGDFGRGVHADGHSLWIDPRDGRHMILGTDGGVYVTFDRGANWDHLNHAAIGQFYHVAISPRHPYHVTGGLQDNGSWFGPNLARNGAGPINEDWLGVSGGDGFVCRVDPNEPDLVYFESQNGMIGRRNLRTGERASIRPARQGNAPAYRFNWNTPFVLSHHNTKIFYCAGNHVFRSFDRGNDLQAISPEITLTKRGSATALAESPRNPSVLYAGTDDGALWVTRDGGTQWKNVTTNLGIPAPRWVSTIEASRFEEGRVYVCLDGHRSDDDEPYLFVSEDFGETWKSLRANIAWGSTRCLREDIQNPNLLFAGTEFALWCSLDRGRSWNKMNNNLPTVAIHELAFHPTNGEVVAATHGRSLWICDITPLRQMSAEKLTKDITLYQSPAGTRWLSEPSRGGTNRRFVGTNPAPGVPIFFSLPHDAERVSVKIVDISGNTVREIQAPTETGLHRVTWDMTRMTPAPGMSGRRRRPGSETGPSAGTETAAAANQPPQLGEAEETAPSPTPATESARTAAPAGRREGPSGAGSPAAAGGSRPGGFGTRIVAPGAYRVVLNVDGKEFSQTLRVDPDPNLPPGQVMEEEDVMVEEEDEEKEEERERLREADSEARVRIDD